MPPAPSPDFGVPARARLAVLDGVPAELAVADVCGQYAGGAVETAWQRRYVTEFAMP